MSDFQCNVVRLTIEPHPNADAIELARVGGYQAIVRKGDFKTGDLAVYIPEQAIVPDWLLEKMGLTGKLSGGAKNRVKAIKLRGIVSQGLVLAGNHGDDIKPSFLLVTNSSDAELSVHHSQAFNEDDDVAEFLGIVKYEPALPSHMAGRVVGVDYANTIKYDFENIKKNPSMFEQGEHVAITEKIHGTFMVIGVLPPDKADEKYYKGRVIMSSKGMSAKGWLLDPLEEGNVYAQAVAKFGLLDKMFDRFADGKIAMGRAVYLMGEVFGVMPSGKGVQDLTYGGKELQFLAFDLAFGERDNLSYFDHDTFQRIMSDMGIFRVPTLYCGPFSEAKMLELTDGTETVSGLNSHIREGVVVKHFFETPHPHYGRKIAKSVSSAYLLRKSADATEFA
jgi:RNA ligase (TIGR02306 family)